MNRLALFLLFFTNFAFADVTRVQAIAIAEKFVNHQWTAEARHARHGKDATGIEIHTPDQAGGHANPNSDAWTVGKQNTGSLTNGEAGILRRNLTQD